MLAAGLASFLALIAVMRWSNGDPLVQPSGDVGILIGLAMVALYFVMSEARASKSGCPAGPSAGVELICPFAV